MDDQEYEHALDELLSQPPEDFVGARNALVRSLKSAGRKEDAAALARWRRPTRTAWALNRLAQADHDAVGALVDAARAVRDSQAAGGASLRDAMGNLRSATRAATDAAESAIAPARPTDAADISAALLAVLTDGDALDLLAAGRLLEIPESGLGAFAAGLAPPEVRRPSTKPVPKRPRARLAPVSSSDTETAREEARRAALRDAREAADQARGAHERADAEAGHCDLVARLAEERVDRARSELAEAETAAEAARDAAGSATDAAAAAAHALAEAERAVARLEDSATE